MSSVVAQTHCRQSHHMGVDTVYFRTIPEVFLYIELITFELCIAQETAELSVDRMNLLMSFQFTCCIQLLWTFIANIRLHTFMSWCRCMCCLPFWLNFFRQMRHVNQVPSLCDFSRCVSSCVGHINSEQCLHENSFVPVWIRTWRFKSPTVINCFSQ